MEGIETQVEKPLIDLRTRFTCIATPLPPKRHDVDGFRLDVVLTEHLKHHFAYLKYTTCSFKNMHD